MPKNTGKKLADMLYGDNPERAAFGVYPQAGKRGQRQPSAKQQLEQIFSDDRAMDLPQFGDVDLSVPTAANRALGQRMTEREVGLKRQADRDMSPLEKLAGGMQAGRLMGSGLVQAAKSIPTAITKGGKAAEEYIAENIYKPTQPKAYEYAGDVGDFLTSLETDYKLPPMMPEAMALQHLLGPATQQARKAVPQAVRQGALNLAAPRTLNPQAGVIKMKGGNWLGGSVEKALEGLKRPDRATGGRADPKESMAEMKAVYTPEALATMSPETKAHVAAAMQDLERKIALNDWVDRNLGNYVKKEMATPEDPVRRLAEEGITHLPANDIDYVNQWIPEHLAVNRMKAGFPSEGMGQSNIARGWETLTDNYISSAPAREYTKPLTESEARRGLKSVVDDNPWLSKLDPETQVTYLDSPDSMREELGFDHILDVLRQDVAEGRIRPEQLNKVSMEQAVRRTAEYDQEMARKMRETQLKQQEGFPVHKEYPEGYKWIELRRPDTPLPEGYEIGANDKFVFDPQGRDVQHPNIKALEDALKYEGNTMGHCVGGYCPDVLEGRSRIYSLRDAKGEPHVTIETAPFGRGSLSGEDLDGMEPGLFQKFLDQRYTEGGTDSMHQWLKANRPELASQERVVQIKGKQNAAPKEDYLPYVQDFVRSGDWSDVGDFQNTGLAKLQPGSDLEKWLQEKKIELPKYPTKQELNKYEADFLLEQLGVDKFNELGLGFLKGENGMARGGPVQFSGNPDVMQLELAGGGIVSKLAKMARAPAKTKAEIEALAERLAPQVTGEYVRKDAKSAKTVADKTQKQFQREKTLPVDVRPTAEVRTPQPVDIEKLKGEVMIGVPGDPTLTGKTLYSVGDVKLDSPSPQHGGPQYGLYNDEGNFWASGIGAARRVQNLAREAGQQYDAPVLGNYIMMGPESINYAQHFADANLQAIDLSKMTKKQVDQFNKLIRFGSNESGPRPNFPGIEDKGEAYLQMAMDPPLRKHFNALMQQPTVTEALNLPSGTDIRFAITEPSLRDLETGVTGYSMGRMRPDISASELKLSQHPTYSHDIPGQFIGESKYPMPYELSFPDTLKTIREDPKQAPHEFGSLKMVGPRQIIDQQMIDEIRAYEERMKQLTGKKAGGAVRKAEGGGITADDLILEERKL